MKFEVNVVDELAIERRALLMAMESQVNEETLQRGSWTEVDADSRCNNWREQARKAIEAEK